MSRHRARTVVTPEHVEVRLVPAGLGSRFIALVVDAGLALGLSALLYRLLVSLLPEGLGLALAASLSFVVTWGYHVYFEVFRAGRTPGKALVRVRVVDGLGLPLGIGQSFARNVLRAVDFLPVFYGLGAGVALLDPARRRLGDLFADTLVVSEQRGTVDLDVLERMRGFESLRTPSMLRRIRHRLGPDHRELLVAMCLRAPGLEPTARFDLFEQVAAYYKQRLEISEGTLSGENLVRGLVTILAGDPDRVGGIGGAARGRLRRS